jgi:glucosamine 6-phosphate synthetase-like amidotransferase/phosphosugar isomerase protein
MCGIAGFSLHEGTTRVDQVRLARALLLGIEPRGRDAAGIAWVGDDAESSVWYQKHNVAASLLVDDLQPAGARSLIAHTRYATQGDPRHNENNHPISLPGIVGVHNGQIANDREIFKMLGCKRDGEVDSEAAFALLVHGPSVLTATVPELLSLIEGSAALAWIATDDPNTLHLARLGYSPLVIATTRKGSLVFASTEDALKKAATAGGFNFRRIVRVPEGTYLRVVNGKVVEVSPIELSSRGSSRRAFDAYKSANRDRMDVAYFDGDDEAESSYWTRVSDSRASSQSFPLMNAHEQAITQKQKRRHGKGKGTPNVVVHERESFPDYDPNERALS